MEQGFERLNARVMAMRAEGLNVTSVTPARSVSFVSGLSTNNFFRTPAWNELRELGLEERIQAIRNPDTRQRLVAEGKTEARFIEWMPWCFYMGDAARPCYTQDLSQNLFDLAEAAGEHPVETWLRMSDETNGKALFHIRLGNRDLTTLPDLLTTEWAMPGLGDAGAHVSQMMDSGWATFILSYWHRDQGLYSIQEAVRRISAMPANVLDLEDRGTLVVGKRADLNVFDIDRLEERMPEIVYDFPFGAPRFIQHAVGYKATVCNGQVVLQDDELTGERSGRILRRRK
jgi:N-acyl-D-aspartate/D-glutamate deacylase